MPYRVELSSHAFRDLKGLDKPLQKRMALAIDALASDPRPPGCVALKGYAHTYRIRVGDYRIIYQVHDKALWVLVLKAGHRGDVYR